MGKRSVSILFLLSVLALFGSRLAAEQPGSAAPLDIGSQLQLFVDDYLIGSTHGVNLKLHEPRPAGKALAFDKPWEGVVSGYATVIEDGGLYRMYYRGASDPTYTLESVLKPGEVIIPAHDDFVCLAESRDGITWTKPALGLFEFQGSKKNNIIWNTLGAANFAPFKDANPAAPAAERYKAVASDTVNKKPVLVAFVSPDGLHWKRLRAEPILTDAAFDSLNVVFWDTLRKQYVAIYRDFDHGVRTIKFATSDDFLKWTPGQWADFGNAPAEHLYTNATVQYPRAPQVYVAIPRRFLPWRTYFEPLNARRMSGVSDAVFMSSRDGVHWTRFEEAFVRPGLDERNWSHRANTPAVGMLQTAPNELSIYMERNYTFPTDYVERMVLRTDGFVSAHADYPGGELITKPIIFKGTSLVLNYSTSAIGHLRIEIQDEKGFPIPGFALEESPLIFGDSIAQTVTWKHPPNMVEDPNPLRPLQGKAVRLLFVIEDADLYSFQFR